MTYLIGGGSLEGVTFDGDKAFKQQIVHNESGFSDLSSSISSSSYQENTNASSITLRRLELNSEQFSHSLQEIRSQHGRRQWQELDASRNQLTTIPPALQQFHTLTYLNLCCNHISIIPSALYQLTKLQYLVLSENQIEVIPDEMPQYLSDLLVLYLDDNRLSELPDTIGHWKKLRELRLGSEFGGNFIEQLPRTLSSMRALIELDVSFNQLQSLSSSTFELERLRYLNLSHNQIAELPQDYTFHACRELLTLDLSDNLITGLSLINARDLTRLMTHERLELLNLSNNQLRSIPTELLEQTHAQVIIKGNPLAEYHHQDSAERESIRMSTQTGTSFSEFDSYLQRDEIHVAGDETQRRALEEMHLDEEPIPEEAREESQQEVYLVQSLREIATRTAVVQYGHILLEELPYHIASEIENALQTCPQCQLPFVHEWVSTTQMKTYRGDSSVAREVRFCTTTCWLNYREMLNQQALAAQSHVILRQRALEYVTEHPQIRNTNSFDYIMAAVLASTEQEQHIDLLANLA